TPVRAKAFLSFSPDGSQLAWSDDESVHIEEVHRLALGPLANRETESAVNDDPLEAEIISSRDTYELETGDLTPKQLSEKPLFGEHRRYPPSAKVDLLFRVRNVSDHKIFISKYSTAEKGFTDVFLIGSGAFNIDYVFQTGVVAVPPSEDNDATPESLEQREARLRKWGVALAPGESFTFPVKD